MNVCYMEVDHSSGNLVSPLISKTEFIYLTHIYSMALIMREKLAA
ncbi:hypothetical protein SAMN05661012_03908 [Chitinophaga sancti]|uniref:Uncharacterized protein n=1 Tax=Chitinophaga sancti TaxID=1004 RepID=A0A1K1RKC4_9BACT|nr:hypothetical protein SAMN05661012_03908 [Chitinophaga sancti]